MNKKIKKIITITMCLSFIFATTINVKADIVDGTQTYQNKGDIPQILQQNNKNYRLQSTKQINYNEDLGIFSTQHYNVWAGSYYITSGNGTWDTGFPDLPDKKNVEQDNHNFTVYRHLNEITEQLTQFCGTGYPRGFGTVTNYQGDVVTITQQEPFVGARNLQAGTGYVTSTHKWKHGYLNIVFYGTYDEIVDKTKPTISVTQNPTSWTNKDVTINYVATDNGNPDDNYEEISGIKEIDKLNNTNQWEKINDNSDGSFTVPQNGDYYVRAVDNANNISEITQINIKNIDKNAPAISGADDYVQDTKTEIAGSPRNINITATDPADNLSIYSGLASIKLIDITNNNNTILTEKALNGEQTENINYVNDKEGKRIFEVIATDRAGNIATKTFTQDIKPKLQILRLSNNLRVYGIDEIDQTEHIGPVNPSLKILSGTKGTMNVETRGAFLVEAEFYENNEPINGIQFDTKNEMVQYSKSYITYYDPSNISICDNQDDNKITLKASDPYIYPYVNQETSFNFILPNTGDNAVKKGSTISIKVIAYNSTGNVINNEIGQNFFVVSDDVRNCIQINNIR